MSVLSCVLLKTCVSAALCQTNKTLTCYDCVSLTGGKCRTSETCETYGACYKLTSIGPDQTTALRGCVASSSSNATTCIVTEKEGTKTSLCYCRTDLCNNSPGAQSPLRISLVLLSVVFVAVVQMVTNPGGDCLKPF